MTSLHPGQCTQERIAELETFIRENIGKTELYCQLVDPISLKRAKCKKPLPGDVPRFTMIVDTAEKDYEDMVIAMRSRGMWAVARSLKHSLTGQPEEDIAGDFAVVEWKQSQMNGDDEDEDDPSLEASGYRAHVEIERKSITTGDAMQSIKTGHRAQQRAAMVHSKTPISIWLWVGRIGDLAATEKAADIKPLRRAVNHDTFEPALRSAEVDNQADVPDFLFDAMTFTAERLILEERGATRFAAPKFSGPQATRRKLDDPDAVYERMLAQVRGISDDGAKAVREQAYPTLLELTRAARKAVNNNQRRAALEKRLGDVEVLSSNASSSRVKQRLGKKANALVQALVDPEEARRKGKAVHAIDEEDAAADVRHTQKKTRVIDDDDAAALSLM